MDDATSSGSVPSSFLDDINTGTGLPAADQPHNVTVRLYDYQRKALYFMTAREAQRGGSEGQAFRGGILADEQGLGKTVMCAALVAAHRYVAPMAGTGSLTSARPCGATLIACTTTIQQQWRHELAKHAPKLRVVDYFGRPQDASEASVRRDVNRLAEADVVLTTYEVLMRELEFVEQA